MTETRKEAIARQHRSCENCKWCVLQDIGYSNYTIEGTEFSCEVRAHPDAPFDRWYGEDRRLSYAIWCEKFSEGLPMQFDVDGEWLWDLEMPEDDDDADLIRRMIVHEFSTPEGLESHMKFYGRHGELVDRVRAIVKAVW